MSARDDYPQIAARANCERLADPMAQQLCQALNEIDRLRLDAAYMEDIAQCRGEENERLRRWKAEATAVITAWDEVWEAAGRPGRLGESKAAAVLALVGEQAAPEDDDSGPHYPHTYSTRPTNQRED